MQSFLFLNQVPLMKGNCEYFLKDKHALSMLGLLLNCARAPGPLFRLFPHRRSGSLGFPSCSLCCESDSSRTAELCNGRTVLLLPIASPAQDSAWHVAGVL